MARAAVAARPVPAKRTHRARTHDARLQPRRRASGPAQGLAATAGGTVALPLPVRVLNAPFTRAVRARSGRLLDALLAGRGWIVLVGVLLAGIVFFNVDLLKLNRDIAATAEQIERLQRENGRHRDQLARLGSSERVQEAAAALGMVLPAPGDVRYLRARPGQDPQLAARRITEPTGLVSAPAPMEPLTAPVSETPATTPAAPVADPAATSTPSADPAAATPPATTTSPATTATPVATGTTGGATTPSATQPTG
jgi:cell division protein FtsL